MINNVKADSIFSLCFGGEGYSVLWDMQELLLLSIVYLFVSLNEKLMERI